jgi:hypothetical protein
MLFKKAFLTREEAAILSGKQIMEKGRVSNRGNNTEQKGHIPQRPTSSRSDTDKASESGADKASESGADKASKSGADKASKSETYEASESETYEASESESDMVNANDNFLPHRATAKAKRDKKAQCTPKPSKEKIFLRNYFSRKGAPSRSRRVEKHKLIREWPVFEPKLCQTAKKRAPKACIECRRELWRQEDFRRHIEQKTWAILVLLDPDIQP